MIDKPSYFIVDSASKKRLESAFTTRGINAKVMQGGYIVVDRLRNSEFGLDLLVTKGK